ncbi:MAG: phytanoyl-CoA dioxygenase family protein [Acidocella sp.]|nr:phytanoyl-CoA dioxygenase family protein [Acidocella sp.]
MKVKFEDLSENPPESLLPPLDRRDVNLASLTENQASWVRDGVVIKKKFIPDELLDDYIKRRAAFRPGTSWFKSGWPDGNCYEAIPELRRAALYPPLMELLKELIGEQMLFHLALTGWISTEREWHQDDYLNPPFVNTWYAAVWIALDTIHPDSGPFEYVRGSHQWPLLRGEKVRSFLTDEEKNRVDPVTGINQWPSYCERYVTPAIEEKIQSSGLPIESFLAEKGDILIWHSRLMHRGSRPKSDILRKSLITHYSGVDHRHDMFVTEADENGQRFAVFKNALMLD